MIKMARSTATSVTARLSKIRNVSTHSVLTALSVWKLAAMFVPQAARMVTKNAVAHTTTKPISTQLAILKIDP